MSPIPADPHEQRNHDLETSDGRKFKVKLPGFPPPKVDPLETEERGAAEPPRDDPRPLVNPDHAGG